ncbi:MAG: SMP-30/gluconolactonase/LRE family protein [Acidimicrobiales bacterium]
MDLELLASGYKLVEAPRTDGENNLYFSDILGGGVYRRSPTGHIETLVPDRRWVGGLALHADGGFVISGKDVVHWKDGETRQLLTAEGINSFNDLHTDAAGRVYTGCIRQSMDDPDAPKTPGEAYRINLDGSTEVLYGDVGASNGIGFSPDGTILYHSDSTGKCVIAHDIDAQGRVSNRRAAVRFERGIPDGMCVDTDGNLWVAHVGGRRVAKFSPAGDLLDEIPVPAKAVTSCAFGGPDMAELYIVSADNTDDAALRGCIWRCRPGATGLPTPLARV